MIRNYAERVANVAVIEAKNPSKILLFVDCRSLALFWKAHLLAISTIALCEPLASLDQLNNVHPLLEKHDW